MKYILIKLYLFRFFYLFKINIIAGMFDGVKTKFPLLLPILS